MASWRTENYSDYSRWYFEVEEFDRHGFVDFMSSCCALVGLQMAGPAVL